jgi:hypothetical protein
VSASMGLRPMEGVANESATDERLNEITLVAAGRQEPWRLSAAQPDCERRVREGAHPTL